MGLKIYKKKQNVTIGTGIHVEHTGYVLISGGNFHDNFGNGLTAHDVGNFTCAHSLFNNNTDTGISVSNIQASSSEETKKMALNIFNNTVNNSEIGISVPESMHGNISGNITNNTKIALQVRDNPLLVQMLKEGYPHDKLVELIKELKNHQVLPEDGGRGIVEKHGIIEWLAPGVTVMEFITAAIELANNL